MTRLGAPITIDCGEEERTKKNVETLTHMSIRGKGAHPLARPS